MPCTPWEKSGRFRVEPLIPVDDPFTAAERVMIVLTRLNGGADRASHLARDIREQVFNSVIQLLPAEDTGKFRYLDNWDGAERSETYRDLSSDENWAALKKLCEPLKIRWSPQQQLYVARGDL